MAPADRPRAPWVTGLVLAAGGSRRLGPPKQLLAYGERTLLDHSLQTARSCGFDQLLCAVGGSADEVRAGVDLRGVEVVENPHFGAGCSSSIAAAVAAINPRSEVLVLLLGDQPGVKAATVRALLAGRGDATLAVCRYDDGRGHPFAFAAGAFAELAALRGDKAVRKLLDRRARDVAEVAITGRVPLDVDTWEDYAEVLATAGLPAPEPVG